ncbi:MAG: 4Fe-4S dicluster domain-containing protein [Chloroflexi bacterium]|nr:4Fe-4S dicluster domain-containing protein [Chloroflexota bacterium]MBM3175966.1 4Fe-4S dicluster domain-containing protein [Chloroflexota bacterium]
MEINRRAFLALSAASAANLVALASAKPTIASSKVSESKKPRGMAVLVDTTICSGCRACFVACKQWNNNPMSPIAISHDNKFFETAPLLNSDTFTNIRASEITKGTQAQWIYTKMQCMHCEHPACAEACIVGALKKTEDGPVAYDEGKCIGCRYCQVACPFGIPNFEWEKPMPWIRKCTFCADRLSAGLSPACVTTCPTGALKFGERDELIAEARSRIAASPSDYVDHIYGENEIGGLSWLYLSPVPFEKLGFPKLGPVPVTVNAARAMGAVPPVLVAVAATMTGIYWFVKRRQKMSQAEESDKNKAEVTK